MRHGKALAIILTMLCAAGARAEDQPGCKLTMIGTATVRTVLDRKTVVLADGREVRLAGIVVPERGDKATLEALVAGREIVLQRLGPETDRYGGFRR